MNPLFPELDPPPASPSPDAPLAERLRPRDLSEFVGQARILGEGSLLRRAIESDTLSSIILWGPPGSGKTTLATIIASSTRSRFVSFSAVLSGIREIKDVMKEAGEQARGGGRRTLLLVDEIHRFNKAQQDAFLPYLERGEIVLIGATTENPSFELNAALLSRSKVYVLERLSDDDLMVLLRRALEDPRGLAGRGIHLEPGCLEEIAARSQGDARFALNALDTASAAGTITPEVVRDALQRAAQYYDKAGEEHFNLISALHKSMRSSAPDASVYWLARMIEAGEDPLYIARRVVRFATEDIGLADPRALSVALAARDAVHFLGLPEGALALAEAVVYMATAPRSDAVYKAWGEALTDVRSGKSDPVPLHLRNAPNALMKDLGYGEGYRHAHQFEKGITDQECLPPRLAGRTYFRPSDSGYEKMIRERLAWIAAIREKGARPKKG